MAMFDLAKLESYEHPAVPKSHRFCLFAVLAYSRFIHISIVSDINSGTVLSFVENAFGMFGGCPRFLNLDICLASTTAIDKRYLKSLGGRDGFSLMHRAELHVVGYVEKMIHALKQDILNLGGYISFEELSSFCEKWKDCKNSRVDPLTGRSPVGLLAEEDLIPLPSEFNSEIESDH
ncbi:hypothetical protein [Pelagicoccus sp. SDUM812005]|uniref:hypothetical protein n=1 Tax=Pelagicoccus sp. SDUM812005 TaxID=3041257 RepID=UPI00280FE18C|nr:hypothetical protein [Pelagicoccus sp. SDUM812005]MDQ8181887.1 hypothetical protein [Pelagicoccus sp. SDUM812005]